MDVSYIGELYCIDIQQLAVDTTRQRLEHELENYDLFRDYVHYLCQSHETLPSIITDESVSVISYNLGYLPRAGRNHEIGQGPITTSSSTIKSVTNALKLIKVGGLITIASYRGHPGGMEEYNAVNTLCETLDSKYWRVFAHSPVNRPLSPVLFSILKSKSLPQHNISIHVN